MERVVIQSRPSGSHLDITFAALGSSTSDGVPSPSPSPTLDVEAAARTSVEVHVSRRASQREPPEKGGMTLVPLQSVDIAEMAQALHVAAAAVDPQAAATSSTVDPPRAESDGSFNVTSMRSALEVAQDVLVQEDLNGQEPEPASSTQEMSTFQETRPADLAPVPLPDASPGTRSVTGDEQVDDAVEKARRALASLRATMTASLAAASLAPEATEGSAAVDTSISPEAMDSSPSGLLGSPDKLATDAVASSPTSSSPGTGAPLSAPAKGLRDLSLLRSPAGAGSRIPRPVSRRKSFPPRLDLAHSLLSAEQGEVSLPGTAAGTLHTLHRCKPPSVFRVSPAQHSSHTVWLSHAALALQAKSNSMPRRLDAGEDAGASSEKTASLSSRRRWVKERLDLRACDLEYAGCRDSMHVCFRSCCRVCGF